MPKDSVTSFIRKHKFEANYQTMFTDDGFQRLRTYLGRVSKGQDKIYTAPFARGQSMSKVMKDWRSVLVSIRDEWPSLWAFENDLAKKVGPMSVMLPFRERIPDVAHYWEDILLPSKIIDPRAIDAVVKEFAGISGLRMRSTKETVLRMKKSTSSGAPYFTKRRNVVLDTIPCRTITFTGRHPQVKGLLKGSGWDLPAIIGWRGQEGGPVKDDVKQRVIWMFPFSVNINELQVYQPLIEAAQRLHLVPAWVSMDEVDERITKLFDTKSRDDLVVCTDFSRFDQHFNGVMQEAASTILRSLLTNDADHRAWLDNVFWAKYFINLVVPSIDSSSKSVDVLGEERHGMASGSGGTNSDETLVHRALQHEAAILHNESLNPNSQCLGDDGILSYPGITVEDVVEAYQSHGQECNPDKQYASSQDCVYLRRWHHKDYRMNGVCVGVYSTFRALGRLRYLERYMDPDVWSPTMVALRQLSILENVKFHPLRNEFLEFCMARDKYRLGVDIPGFLDSLPELAKEAIDYMPDFLGYTKTLQGEGPSGISNWWVVQQLKSMS